MSIFIGFHFVQRSGVTSFRNSMVCSSFDMELFWSIISVVLLLASPADYFVIPDRALAKLRNRRRSDFFREASRMALKAALSDFKSRRAEE